MEAFCLEPESGNRIFDGYPFKSGSGDSFDLSLNIAAAASQSTFPMSAEQGYQPNGGLKEEFEMSSVMNDGGDLVNRPPASMFTSMEMSVPMTSTVDTMTSSGYQPPHHPYYYCQTTDMYNSGHPGPPAPGPPGHYPLGPLPHHASFVQQMVPPHLRQQSPYQGQGHGLMGPPLSVSPGQVTTSPGRTGDEPGSDSSALSQWMCNKRPSPDPIQMESVLKPAKKPKTSKKKKKRDPNEPQKPVSAYALFFRDTQAAIKGSNPNASFGEISKIVASMWDALDSENKNMYKKKTENAKKEYLKALAAYRANLISKSNAEDHQIQQQQHQQQSAAPSHHSSAAAMYGGYPFSGAAYNPGGFPGHYGAVSAQSVMAKRSPLLSSLMAGDARTQDLMPAHGLYQHQSPAELLGGAGAGGPPSSMMLGGGGGGYHRGGGPALPGGIPPSQQPPQSMMPPVSQPLYMHHHGAVLTAAHHPQPPPMHHHSQQVLSDRAAMGSPLQQLSPSAQPLAPSPQQPSYHQMSPPRHSPPHPRHLSSQSPSSQMEPPAHSPCGVARSPGLVADWQHTADIGGASGHQHQRDVTGECLVGPCREVYKTWPAGVASGANPGGFVPSQSAPAAPAN